MKYKFIVLLVSLSAFGLVSCVSDIEEEIAPASFTCDTEGVTFSGTVLPLIEANCYQCHDAATRTSGVNLEGYDNIKARAVTGQLVGVISHAPGFAQMPKNRAQLPTCDIESIKKWIEDGTPQN